MLLQSLQRETPQLVLQQQAAAARAADASTCVEQLVARWHPVTEALAGVLRMCAESTAGAATETAEPPTDVPKRQQPEGVWSVLPVHALEAVLRRSLLAALQLDSQDSLSLQSQPAATAPSGSADDVFSKEFAQAAKAQLLGDLSVLLPCWARQAANYRCRQALRAANPVVTTPQAVVPSGLWLQQLIGVLPASVAVAVCADTSAASALSVVFEAAAAMGLPAECIHVHRLPTSSGSAAPCGHLTHQPSGSLSEGVAWEVLLVDTEAGLQTGMSVVHQHMAATAATSSSSSRQRRLWLAVGGTALCAHGKALLSGACFVVEARSQQQPLSTSAAAAGEGGRAATTMSLLLKAQGAALWQQCAAGKQLTPATQLWLQHAGAAASSSIGSRTRSPAGSGSRDGNSNAVSGSISGSHLCILQPLMVAAAAAMATGSKQWGVTTSDLFSPQDLQHMRLVLQRIAAHAAAQLEPHTGGGASDVVGLQGPHSRLKHNTDLPLDLQQLQQLLQWAVVGPSCTRQQQLAAGAHNLSQTFSASVLGVRQQLENLGAGAQVVGTAIVDTLEDAAAAGNRGSQIGGRSSDDSGTTSETRLEESQQPELLPLGMCLGLQDLFALLESRLG